MYCENNNYWTAQDCTFGQEAQTDVSHVESAFGRAEDLFSFWDQRGQPGPSSFPDHIANCVYLKFYLFSPFTDSLDANKMK